MRSSLARTSMRKAAKPTRRAPSPRAAPSGLAVAAWTLVMVACAADKPDAAPVRSFPDDAGASASRDASTDPTRRDAGSPTSIGRPGACLAKEELPRNCDEACQDQGRTCAEDCNFSTPLPAVAGYYASLSGCEQGQGTVFAVTAGCDDPFDNLGFLPYVAVRCCCKEGSFKVASAAEKTPLCEAACAKDTNVKVPECEMFSGCGERCLDATRGLDLGCARCLIDKVGFTSSHCSSWECVCGGASFPSAWTACQDECAAAQQHERELYEAEPRPVPVGRAPAARLDAPAIPDIRDLLVDDQGRLWVAGTTRSEPGRTLLTLALFDADLSLRWRWDDPARRALTRWSGMARLAGEVAVAVEFAEGSPALLFFDAEGALREQASALKAPTAIDALGDKLLVKYAPSAAEDFSLALADATGAVRYAAPRSVFEGLAPFRWLHAVQGDGFSLLSPSEGMLTWQRMALPMDLATGSATQVWVRRFDLGPIEPAGAAAIRDDLLVWGSLREKRANWSAGFPWLAQLGNDGSVRFQWWNDRQVTPGSVSEAVQTAAGRTCTVGAESWEDSTSDVPTTGPRCSPDGCDALTVRCFDAGGKELWKYHHRSERSAGYAITADGRGRLYVAGTITHDPQRSTGSRAVLLRFDP